jgi:hypothetical protein
MDVCEFHFRFEINDQTGEALNQTDMTALHYQRIAGQSANEKTDPKNTIRFQYKALDLVYIFPQDRLL